MAEKRASSQFIGGDEMRASDHDRELVTQQLEEHYAAGRLTFDEVQQRIDSVYRSRTYGDLRELLRDLPATRTAPSKRSVFSVESPLVLRISNLSPAMRQYIIKYVAISALLIVIWAATGADFFWPIWPMFGLGIHFFRLANGHEGCMTRHQRRHPERS